MFEVSLTWLLLCLAQTEAQAPPALPVASTTALRFLSQTIETTNLEIEAQSRAAEASVSGVWVIQFRDAMTPSRRSALKALHADLLDYIPDRAFLIRIPDESADLLRALPGLVWMERFRPEWKLDPELGQRSFATPERRAEQALGRCRVLVHLLADQPAETVAPELAAHGINVLSSTKPGRRPMIHAEGPISEVKKLGELDAVQYIEEAPELTPRNDTDEWIFQSNRLGETPIWDQGLHGEDQMGGLIDWPPNVDHCAFADDSAPIGSGHRKIQAYRSSTGQGSDTHGTHVAGTYVGDTVTVGEHDFRDGMAFAARLTYSSAPDINLSPDTLFDRLSDAQADGAWVHSNSWGDDSSTAYSTWCEQADRFMWTNEEALVVFATTNQSTLRSPENAKNILAVGATRDTPSQDEHCFGGTGPTSDGRRKPEIFAPGCTTFSASASTECGFASFNGTSYATPVISAAAILTRQYFMEGFYPSGQRNAADAMTPSGALLKAVLLNSTVDMSGELGFPSDQEGWGRILLDNALHFDGEARGLFVAELRNAEGLSTGETRSYVVSVASNAEPLRVTLCWTDFPGTVGTESAAVNNLDLTVTPPQGGAFLGNVFSEGESAPGGEADAINNVEQILISLPAAGDYVVGISAADIEQELQGFGLVVSGDLGDEPPPPACVADFNGDGMVDVLDVNEVRNGFCLVPPCPDELDPNGDGVVNPLDLGYVLARLGACP